MAFSAHAADTAIVSVGATVLSKNNCKFQGSTALALAFGNIDPSSASPATASTGISFKCGGSSPTASYSITHDSGLYETGVNANRMKHATLNEYLPYTFSLTPSSGTVAKNVSLAITVDGSIAPASFQDASMGAYSDTIVVTVNP
ncbi:MAG: spore coat protein U domain-containing protein [Sulfuritalea sp.]|nr:spore coat protein U domain-containing protein [Sulfuritalea sp.]MDP1983083.1 spore coat protein U domain-containing protein [Sulfuritalea sp.]